MTPGLIKHATGGYKSEWDSISEYLGVTESNNNLPPVPDYEEIMIWDKQPGRSGDDHDMNPEDGYVGNFMHPNFFEEIDSGDIDRSTGFDSSEPHRPIGMIHFQFKIFSFGSTQFSKLLLVYLERLAKSNLSFRCIIKGR